VADHRDELGVEGLLGFEVRVEGPDRKLRAVVTSWTLVSKKPFSPKSRRPDRSRRSRTPSRATGRGRGGAAEDLAGIEVEAAEEAVREDPAGGLERAGAALKAQLMAQKRRPPSAKRYSARPISRPRAALRLRR
jgi:hypothetical protein